MKNLILLIFASLSLFAVTSQSPLAVNSRAVDTGGTKPAIDAYSDGGGVLIIKQAADTKIDNSAMNSLVFKYGSAAKTNGVSLSEEVKTISTTSTAEEKLLADKLNSTNLILLAIVNGTSCDDYNPQTTNDVFTDGICAGVHSGYKVIDLKVNGWLASNGATITEIELYDINNNKLSYNFALTPGSAAIPYLLSANYWSGDNLKDQDFTYTSNGNGLTSSLYLTVASLRLTSTSYIKKMILYIGSPEGRVPTTLDIKDSGTGEILQTITGSSTWTTVRPITINF